MTQTTSHDLRSKINAYAAHYNPKSKEQFIQLYNQVLDKFDADKEIASSIFLDIYANSVDNVVL